jgi:hypothetical protein
MKPVRESMKSLTIRNIRGDVLERARERADRERRSLNNEILVLIETALDLDTERIRAPLRKVAAERQARLWAGLCGRWQDERGWEEIARDIVGRRSTGRKVAL